MHRRLAIIADLDRHPPEGVSEYVPGFTTCLLRFDTTRIPDVERHAAAIARRLDALTPTPPADGPIQELPVTYDGEDLASLAAEKGLAPADVVRLHSERVYHVQLIGFSPGFPYLGALHPRLHTPRRSTPRPRVAAGAVAIGGEHTGIYSIDSPGGWHVIGRTSAPLFAPGRAVGNVSPADVFLLHPGDRVRFVPIEPPEA